MAVESTGNAKAEAESRAEAARIEGEGSVLQAKLKAQALAIETVSWGWLRKGWHWGRGEARWLKAPKPSGIPSRQPDAKCCSGSQGFAKSALGNGRRGSLVIPQLSAEASPTLWCVLYIRDLIPCLRYLSPPFYTAAWTGGPLPKSHQLKSGLAGVCT